MSPEEIVSIINKGNIRSYYSSWKSQLFTLFVLLIPPIGLYLMFGPGFFTELHWFSVVFLGLIIVATISYFWSGKVYLVGAYPYKSFALLGTKLEKGDGIICNYQRFSIRFMEPSNNPLCEPTHTDILYHEGKIYLASWRLYHRIFHFDPFYRSVVKVGEIASKLSANKHSQQDAANDAAPLL
ncbi:hypothetical protein [Aurantivibrio infirmus]